MNPPSDHGPRFTAVETEAEELGHWHMRGGAGICDLESPWGWEQSIRQGRRPCGLQKGWDRGIGTGRALAGSPSPGLCSNTRCLSLPASKYHCPWLGCLCWGGIQECAWGQGQTAGPCSSPARFCSLPSPQPPPGSSRHPSLHQWLLSAGGRFSQPLIMLKGSSPEPHPVPLPPPSSGTPNALPTHLLAVWPQMGTLTSLGLASSEALQEERQACS